MLYEQKKGTLVKHLYNFVFLLFFVVCFNTISATANRVFRIPFDYSLSGYIKGEYYSDSRQTFDAQFDDIPFFPKPQVYDPAGQDVNSRARTQMNAFETRVRLGMVGPVYGKAPIEGVMEVDFEIFYPEVIDLPHMRHAFGKVQLENSTILFGQMWHPIVYIEPPTIDYDGTAPYDYYARAPQLTVTYQVTPNIDIITSALMQVDYLSDGPYGETSQYMRWATMPNFHLQAKWHFKEHLMAVGVDYKRIAPRITSDQGYHVYERLSSFAGLWYLGLKWPQVEFNAKINMGQNVSDYNGMGGYAVRRNSANPVTGERKYTNLSNLGAWADIVLVKNPNLQPGVFCAFSKNLGSGKPIELDVVGPDNIIIERNVYGFANDCDYTFRIASRFSGKVESIIFALEVQYTRAYFGKLTPMGHIAHTQPVENIRCMFASYYYF